MSKAKRTPPGDPATASAPAPAVAPPYMRWDGEDLLLDCHLQPKASRDEFAGLQGERLKIRLTAPPVDGKANAQLQAFLAQAFGVAKRQVTLEAGELNRLKRVRIRHPAILPAQLHLTARPV